MLQLVPWKTGNFPDEGLRLLDQYNDLNYAYCPNFTGSDYQFSGDERSDNRRSSI